jgi:hypothetical protein
MAAIRFCSGCSFKRVVAPRYFTPGIRGVGVYAISFSRRNATQPGTCASLKPCSNSGPWNRWRCSRDTYRMVVRVAPPHAAAVAGAGAQMDLRGAQLRTRLGQDPQPPQARLAVFGVGMAHVESALHGRDRDSPGTRFTPNPAGDFGRNCVGQIGKASAVEAHLDTIKAAGLHRIEPRLQRSALERSQQDTDLDCARGIGLRPGKPGPRASGPECQSSDLRRLFQKFPPVHLFVGCVHGV